MNVTDIIHEALAQHRTRFAFELLPPLKGDGTGGVFGAIDPLMEFDPAYINITFHREGIKQTQRPDGSVEWHVVRRRPGTVGISAAIRKRYGVEVVPHLICGGLSKYDIEDALIDMDFLGLHNVLALRGDKSQNERFFMPHPQGHAHAVDLVRQIAAMNRGEFVDGEVEVCHHSKFSIGVAGYPETHEEAASPEADILHLKEKVARLQTSVGGGGICIHSQNKQSLRVSLREHADSYQLRIFHRADKPAIFLRGKISGIRVSQCCHHFLNGRLGKHPLGHVVNIIIGQ